MIALPTTASSRLGPRHAGDSRILSTPMAALLYAWHKTDAGSNCRRMPGSRSSLCSAQPTDPGVCRGAMRPARIRVPMRLYAIIHLMWTG